MVDQIRVKGGMLLGALVSGALAAGTLSVGAPTANATCASFWGINNGGGCTSTLFNVAIGIGTGATANATGFFSSAFAIGNGADASSIGALDIASAVGPDSRAGATGNLNIAGALGFTGGTKYTQANAGNGSSSFANIAVSLGNDSFAGANDASPGSGNLALNLGQGNNVVAAGYLSTAISVGGNQSYVNNNVKTTGGVLNSAFSLFGNQNSVTAGPGPFAIAGSIFQNGQPVTKVNPGFNINGLKVPNTATAVRTGNKTAAPAAATNNRRQKPAPAATATGRGKR